VKHEALMLVSGLGPSILYPPPDSWGIWHCCLYTALSLSSTPLLRKTTSELWCLSGGKRGDYQNFSVLYCVMKLCTVISTLIWAVLTVLWIWFCHTGPISLCINLFVFTTHMLYYC